MSHVCARCGSELSHLRAPPDPIYGLPIVVCPGCGLVGVRHGLIRAWDRSSVGAILNAIGAASWRALALATAVLLGAAVMIIVASIIESVGLNPRTVGADHVRFQLIDSLSMWGVALGLGALCTLMIGLLLAASLGHLGFARRTLAWAVGFLVIWWVLPGIDATSRSWFAVAPEFGWNMSRSTSAAPFRWNGGSAEALLVLGLVAAMVLAWTPVIEPFRRYMRRQVWLAKLTRERKRRLRRRG